MTTTANISSVAYKKGNLMRYVLWALGATCIGIMIYTFFTTMNASISASAPPGYNFSVVDNYNGNGKLRTTYYVYDDKIFVENESFNDDSVDRSTRIYEGINTTNLDYNPKELAKTCELGACYKLPKVINDIKALLSDQVGREYIGF